MKMVDRLFIGKCPHRCGSVVLIDDGARVDVLDEDGRSPLHW